MNTRARNRNQLAKNVSDKKYRETFVESHIRNGVAFQIRAMRDMRGWTQKELAKRADTKQEAISRLENPDYGRFTLETLRRLASVFDVALTVRFVPFSELIDRMSSLTPRDMEIPDFAHDEGIRNFEGVSANVQSIFPAEFGDAKIIKPNSTRLVSSNG
jgi:transcriptional regulator with XRE-family HTH domain